MTGCQGYPECSVHCGCNEQRGPVEACEVCCKALTGCTCDECSACSLLVAATCGERDDGYVFCNSDCRDNYAERAHERMLSDYYGGSAPFNDRERADVEGRVRR